MADKRITPSPISLLPLSLEHHAAALQQVYRATPGYWQMYGLPSSPAGQAEHDLREAAEMPDRYLLGIVRRLVADDPQAGGELIGLVDFRLHWPRPKTVYLGMIMVAEPYQRQGIGTQAWLLLRPWLVETAHMSRARVGVAQFNIPALKFFQSLGFTLTGESNRIRSGTKWVRLLYMEQALEEESGGESGGL
ncbi:GNAT family N-acetyltransferase [Litorilinea aerophila]|uniref:N-acetyltransferase n=1 Tax=Litorilinea aerophila TaxID=1204385 RepID=A0A540VMI5_9CHLR|nr:GNAT family N-acetyltransferase [Litorilinea aerophila]MCC9074679.1 GNAT family N-acetyltransferase [Litorilinea aerophila]